ncbi:MAG TPA: phosphatase PAP2 family protein [Archangium sp.]|uniref:phosphatase PAP2 family protein n=1 Tax=Archangium sp. TaxID=1872627 RepID=UPI002E32C57E|nr:phosphatase PAP2 family protein [Archangium sp.]HEX5750654.1 phosphatase PAP2 family protein [Archangium sp.]
MPTALCFLALASLAASSPLPSEALPSAARQAADAPTVQALDFDWTRDGAITAAAGVLWIGSEALFKKDLAPKTCRWCDRSVDGTDTLNGFDRWGRSVAADTFEGRERWDLWSNIGGFGVLPVGVLGAQYLLSSGSGAPLRYYAQDATIIIESVAVAALVNQVVKFSVGRERPFVHVLPEDQKGSTRHPTDNNLSFYSGHTNMAFALVTAAGTVSELRGYKNRWLIWAVGLPAAASIGLLRMGADRHYLTDVLVGAAAGTIFGVGMPLLLHGREEAPASRATSMSMNVSGGLGGVMFSGQF